MRHNKFVETLPENTHIVHVGFLNCIRHKKGFLLELFKNRQLSFLCPSEIDYISGAYYNQIIEAIVNIHKEQNINNFLLRYGCQCYLLATDFDMLKTELKNNYNINLQIDEHCHLCENRKEHI